MAEPLVIETAGLCKRYGEVEALRGLDLQVPAGSICGLLGRNGAGKTTTIDAASTRLVGTWSQRSLSLPLTFARDAK